MLTQKAFWHLKNLSYLEAQNIQGKKDGKLGGNFSYVEAIHKKIAEVLERLELPELFLSSVVWYRHPLEILWVQIQTTAIKWVVILLMVEGLAFNLYKLQYLWSSIKQSTTNELCRYSSGWWKGFPFSHRLKFIYLCLCLFNNAQLFFVWQRRINLWIICPS